MQYKNKCEVELGGKKRTLVFTMETFLQSLTDFQKKGIKDIENKPKLMLVTYVYYAIMEMNDFVSQDLPENFDLLMVKDWIEAVDIKTQNEITLAMTEGTKLITKKSEEAKNEIEKIKKKNPRVKK